MAELDYFILEARSKGQSDDITRQQLIGVGWPKDQVDSALALPVHDSTQKKSKKIWLFGLGGMTLFIIGVILIGASLGENTQTKTSYIAVAKQFITAIRKNDETKADSLESQSLKTEVLQSSGTTSFDKFCKKYGQECTFYFSTSFINKAKVNYSNYVSSSGAKGKTITLSLAGSNFPTANCTNSNSSMTLTMGLIPTGNTWLVDSVIPGAPKDTITCSPA